MMERIADNIVFQIGVFIVGAFVFVGILLSIMFFTFAFMDMQKCDSLQSIHEDFEFKWNLWTGCLVKTPSGLWVDTDVVEFDEVELWIGE